jgi:hypothetical protein
MAKFDLVKYSEMVKANRPAKSKNETVGTRIIRIIVGMIATFMIWSTITVLDLSPVVNTILNTLLGTAFIAYVIFVLKKE